METKETQCHPKPLVNATCLLGKKGCYENGKCHYIGSCEHKVLTHADRIRAMTDEELVENFRDLMPDELFCSGVCPDGGQDSIPPCDLCRLKWLKQPAEGGMRDGI